MGVFDRAVREGHLYPRWQAGYNFAYGLPWLNDYSRGFYFVAEAVHLMLRRPMAALFFVTLWLMTVSGLACYAFVRHFCSPLAVTIHRHVNVTTAIRGIEAFLVAGKGNVEVLRWGALTCELIVSLESEGVLRLRSYNFPGWTGRMDGRTAGAVISGLALSVAFGFFVAHFRGNR